jgi:hypothetical protein
MMTKRLQQSGFEIMETLEVRGPARAGPPRKEDLEKAKNLGKHIAQRIKEGVKA